MVGATDGTLDIVGVKDGILEGGSEGGEDGVAVGDFVGLLVSIGENVGDLVIGDDVGAKVESDPVVELFVGD